jgi:hypothetical protein
MGRSRRRHICSLMDVIWNHQAAPSDSVRMSSDGGCAAPTSAPADGAVVDGDALRPLRSAQGPRWLVRCRPWGIVEAKCVDQGMRSEWYATGPLNGCNGDLRMNKPRQWLTESRAIPSDIVPDLSLLPKKEWALNSRPGWTSWRTLWLSRGDSICSDASRTTDCEFTAWMSIFWDSWLIQSVEFNRQLGMSISQLGHNNSERNEHQWQQWIMAPRIYELNVNIRAKRMRNCLSKPRERNNQNLRRRLPRYVVLWYERKPENLPCTTNNKVWEIIQREHKKK